MHFACKLLSSDSKWRRIFTDFQQHPWVTSHVVIVRPLRGWTHGGPWLNRSSVLLNPYLCRSADTWSLCTLLYHVCLVCRNAHHFAESLARCKRWFVATRIWNGTTLHNNKDANSPRKTKLLQTTISRDILYYKSVLCLWPYSAWSVCTLSLASILRRNMYGEVERNGGQPNLRSIPTFKLDDCAVQECHRSILNVTQICPVDVQT